MTRNQLAYQQNLETQRANLAKESENYRSNVAREQEAHRAAVAQEQETRRHNQNSERISGLTGTLSSVGSLARGLGSTIGTVLSLPATLKGNATNFFTF